MFSKKKLDRAVVIHRFSMHGGDQFSEGKKPGHCLGAHVAVWPASS